MRRSAALALVLVLAACGGHAKRTLKPTVSTPVARGSQLRVTITAPTHHPRANAKWPVTVRAVNGNGQDVHATLTMRILLNGSPVGKVDNGRVFHFFGTWREKSGQEITWPKASRGQALQFEAIVSAQHKTVKQTYAITVR